MDISPLKIAEEPQKVKINHPKTGKPTDIIIHCISPDHPEYKNKAIEAVREKLKPDEKIDVSKVMDQKAEIVAAMIVNWGGIEIKGKPFKYSKTNAVILMREYPWIMEQVDKFCGDRANFFEGSGKA